MYMHIKRHITECEAYGHSEEHTKLSDEPKMGWFSAISESGDGIPLGYASFHIADKTIRCCKKSFYKELQGMHYSRFLRSKYIQDIHESKVIYPSTIVRHEFYEHQIKNEVNQVIHDNTLLITFDGLNAAGKGTLTKLLRQFLYRLDHEALEGTKGLLHQKPSALGGLEPLLEHHKKKQKAGERGNLASLDFVGHMYQFAIALTKVAAEKPKVAFLDRSYITSMAKASQFLEQRKEECIGEEMLLWEESKDKPLKLVSVKHISEMYKRSNNKAWQQRLLEEFPYLQLRYLIKHMEDKYIVPDLSMVLMCTPETSQKRQEDRWKKTGRKPKKVDKEEEEWYSFFKKNEVLPNAVYLNTDEESISNQFHVLARALKERAEDKGDKHAILANKITETSIEEFLKSALCAI